MLKIQARKRFKTSFYADWKNVLSKINNRVVPNKRSCRVEDGPKLNMACIHVY